MNTFALIFVAVIVVRAVWDILLDWLNLRYTLSPASIIPEVLKDKLTMEDFAKAKSYLKDRTYFGILSKLVSLAVDLVLILKIFPLLENVVSAKSSVILQAILFFALYYLIEKIVELPFKVYSTFVIEQKYGFNTTTPKLFARDEIISTLLAAAIGFPIIAVIMMVIKYTVWWWQLSLFAILFILFFSFIQPILIAPLFYKFSKLEDEELEEKINQILNRAKIKVPNIFKMDASRRTKKQNAYVTGIGKSRRLVLFDTILSYSHDEILAVVAHELGHHVRRHLPKLIILNALFIAFVLYLTNWTYNFINSAKIFGASQPYTNFAYAFIFISSLMFFIEPLVNFFSRKMEYEADEYSAKLLGTSEPLISSLKRLVKENLSNPNPMPLYKAWHYSHPAPEERIKHLLELKI
ncbi:M48 family metallopeptidase [Fervidobacterium riparium]|uniref:STE24 endopeptidase n=1 Tax=Fervidobacterium gondwanense DSM 13020 TaxID=1121883 RepID=A0A1M7SS25_FERGO|nr:M48 family metallopeptidase [Fervidobacterium gondwanense]UXF00580.1 peptidase [Fervidobacterium riparium]SHN61347.1 STE24 endopeptidase [Fervidobacterium gondwanense DSM 13020]